MMFHVRVYVAFVILISRTQACKHYDYIILGQNDDILNFDINFKNAFFTAIAMTLEIHANNDTVPRGLATNLNNT